MSTDNSPKWPAQCAPTNFNRLDQAIQSKAQICLTLVVPECYPEGIKKKPL